jgi:hypothetical protein
MPESHGSKAKFFIGTTDISGYLRSVEQTREGDTAEVSALGDVNKRYVVGLQDASFPLEGNFEPVADALFAGMQGATAGTAFKYFPQGSVTGLPFYSGSVYLSTYTITTGVDDAAQTSMELVPSSAITRATV